MRELELHISKDNTNYIWQRKRDYKSVFETVDNFIYLRSKVTPTNNFYDKLHRSLLAADRAATELIKMVPHETPHHRVKASTLQDNDHAGPHAILGDLSSYQEKNCKLSVLSHLEYSEEFRIQ